MNRTPDNIDRWYDLIARELAENLSAEEQAKLNSWIQADPANRKLYEEAKKLWSLTDDDTVFFDTEKAWENIQAKNLQAESKTRPMFPWKWAGIAASILLVVSLFWTINSKEETWVSFQTSDSTGLFILPDSSKVWLKENSSIQYLTDFDVNRKVILKGKAYFEVESDPQHPFTVDGGQALVTVLGTGFLVESSDSITLVQVDHGKVQVNDKKNEERKVVLVKDEQVRVTRDSIKKVPIVNKNFHSWQKQELNFEDQPLQEVLPQLESYFNVHIFAESTDILKCRFTATLQKPDLKETLKIITITTGAEIREHQGEYILSGKGCSSN